MASIQYPCRQPKIRLPAIATENVPVHQQNKSNNKQQTRHARNARHRHRETRTLNRSSRQSSDSSINAYQTTGSENLSLNDYTQLTETAYEAKVAWCQCLRWSVVMIIFNLTASTLAAVVAIFSVGGTFVVPEGGPNASCSGFNDIFQPDNQASDQPLKQIIHQVSAQFAFM